MDLHCGLKSLVLFFEKVFMASLTLACCFSLHYSQQKLCINVNYMYINQSSYTYSVFKSVVHREQRVNAYINGQWLARV